MTNCYGVHCTWCISTTAYSMFGPFQYLALKPIRVLTESKCYYNVYYRVFFRQSYLHLCLILLLYNVDLINSHKQVTPHVSGSGSHVSSMNNNISNKSKSSFSWQRTKQPAKEKKPAATGPPRSHSYSLDRRKMTNSSSGRSSRIV